MEVDYCPTSVQARVLPAPTVILLPCVLQSCFVFANVTHFLIITMFYFCFCSWSTVALDLKVCVAQRMGSGTWDKRYVMSSWTTINIVATVDSVLKNLSNSMCDKHSITYMDKQILSVLNIMIYKRSLTNCLSFVLSIPFVFSVITPIS